MPAGSPSTERQSRASFGLLVLAVLAAVAVLYFLTARRTYFFDSDASTYLEVARSLANGGGYSFDGEAHTKFPPGISLLLLPFASGHDGDFELLYRLSAAVSLAALLLAAWWFRERAERRAMWLFALCAASAAWYEFSTGASLSEAPFALVLMALFAGAERALRRGKFCLPAALAGGLLVACAVLLRSAGVAVLAGVLATALHWAWRGAQCTQGIANRSRAALLLGPGALALCGWMLWTSQAEKRPHAGDVGHESSYVSLWTLADPHQPDLGSVTIVGFVQRSLTKVLLEGRHVAEVLTNLNWIPTHGASPFLILALLICAMGLRVEFRRANPLAAWICVSYAGLVVLWPYDEGRRFVMPFVPLIFVLALAGLREIANWWKSSNASRGGWLVAGVSSLCGIWSMTAITLRVEPASTQDRANLIVWSVCTLIGLACALRPSLRDRWGQALLNPRFLLPAFLIAYSVFGYLTIRGLAAKNLVMPSHPMRQTAAKLASRWIEENTAPDACVLATDYAAIRYATQRHVALLPVTSNRARLAAALDDERPDYIVINDPRKSEYFLPSEPERLAVLKEILADRLLEVGRTERGSIWRVLPANH